MKKLLTAVLVIGMILSLTAMAAAPKKIKAGIVLSIGGLGDKSFNDSAYRGLTMAKTKLGIEFKYVEPASPAEDEQYLRQFAQANYDIVIATGFLMKDACAKVAKEFPNVKFAIIDENIDLPNVSSLTFKEDEGSFLVGALAGMTTKTNVVGFIGGMEIPLIKKFQNGYEAGVKYANPKAKVLSVYTSSANPFNDPVKGKENTLSLIKQGADIVYHAAGGTGTGVIEAAKETGKLAIGVDSNQDGMAPGFVLTSMMKNVDIAVFNTVKTVQDGKFKAGLQQFGIKENGVGVTDFQYTKDKLPKDALKKLEDIKKGIIAGKIKVQ